jgi:hypothetical protein
LHLQVVFLDDEARPDGIEQFRLVDNALAPLDQRQQQVERPCAQSRRCPVDQHLPFGGPDFAAPETILAEHRASLAGLPSTA